MRALVVGAGLGGLLVSALLQRKGVETTIVERAQDLGRGGYVLALWRVGVRALEHAGLGDAVEGAGRVVETYTVADQRGAPLKTMRLAKLNAKHGPLVQLHRGTLHGLLRGLPENGGDALRLGTTVESIAEDVAGVDVRFTGGREERFDVVVGADGIRSAVRRLAFPEAAEPTPFGAVGWAFLAPADDRTPEGIVELWGAAGKYVGVYRFSKDWCGVYGAVVDPSAGSQPLREDRRVDLLKRSFEGFGGYVGRLFAHLPERDEPEGIFHDTLSEVKTWRWTKRRVALLGDAAHAMLPFGGMGASMAFEDAVVLADELGRARRLGASISAALGRYERRRRWRVRAVQTNAWMKGLAMLRADRVPLGLRVASAICKDPLMKYDTYQERVLDGFLASSP